MGLVEYIFLSREIPLPLSALKILYYNNHELVNIINFSEKKFKSLLLSLKQNYNIKLRNIEKLVSNFKTKNNNDTFSKIQKNLNICKQNDIRCVSYFDKEFPEVLKTIKEPPKLIFIKGDIKPEDSKAVAVIGTRNPTDYGKKMAFQIAKRFTELGFTIISGLARGIDTIAIESAISSRGRAIGVIASGILNLYPKENVFLAKKLVKNGAIISERFPYDNVNKKALQIRNKITSGFGLGNIVVEGNKFSGTRHQLNFGEQQGKPAIGVEPIDDMCEQAFVPNLIIKEKGGARISNIDDMDYIAEMLLNEYKERKEKKVSKDYSFEQTNLFNF